MIPRQQLRRVSAFLNAAALVIYVGEALATAVMWRLMSSHGHTDYYIVSVTGPLAYLAEFIRQLPLMMLAAGVAIQLYLLPSRSSGRDIVE